MESVGQWQFRRRDIDPDDGRVGQGPGNIGLNDDETHYTIPRHVEAHGLSYVEVEIRQDLVSDEAGRATWAQRISQTPRIAERIFSGTS